MIYVFGSDTRLLLPLSDLCRLCREPAVARVACLDEKLRFLYHLMRRLRRTRHTSPFMRSKEVLSKIAADKWIKEEPSIEEITPELKDNAVRFQAVRDGLPVEQRSRSMQHRLICRLSGPLVLSAIEFQLRFERFAFAVPQLEFNIRDHFAGAFTDTQITDRELSCVCPIRVEGRICLMQGNFHQIFQHALALGFTDPLHKRLEGFISISLCHILAGNAVQSLRNSFRRYGANRQAVSAGILRPLAAEDDLEMRDVVFVFVAAHAIETQIGDMVLSTGIEAAADFDS
jgi:hypothetical protein